jgi:putative flippase GtrA
VIVLIPALEPDQRLVELVGALRARPERFEVLVVDDGSGPRWRAVFAAAQAEGAEVLHLPENRGKGDALKTGLRHMLETRPGEGVVMADSDGQHTPEDIARVAAEAERAPGMLVLGARALRDRAVPWRSRVGNSIARGLFRLSAGFAVTDTQTGLRAASAALLPWLVSVPGRRFEYEQQMLLRARGAGVTVVETPIETVYLDGNSGTHFRPFVDSLRVLLPVLLFGASSLLGFLVDTLALLALNALTGSLVASIVGARVLSASVNFAVNRRFVFRRRGRGLVGQAIRYGLLAALLLASNIVWMQALTSFGVPLLLAKVLTELVLFVTSFQAQRAFVFGSAAAPALVRAERRAGAAVPG